ncbi:MAG: XRE family transcriptional regulator [Lachnospiraceae bacterium]|nr:XRE family transcriptional regulator [Lachnospiraceae bacterium]
MIRAYNDRYVMDAANNMGEMLDYIQNICEIDLDDFWSMFIMSGYAGMFEKGVPAIVAGMSGIELAIEIVGKLENTKEMPDKYIEYKTLSAYWIGWMIAYYQWYSCRTFSEIIEVISFENFKRLHDEYRDYDNKQIIEIIDAVMNQGTKETNLSIIRKKSGLSQRELSNLSGVNIRSIQQYEQRAKDINKAAAYSIKELARVLACRMEDLLEYKNAE